MTEHTWSQQADYCIECGVSSLDALDFGIDHCCGDRDKATLLVVRCHAARAHMRDEVAAAVSGLFACGSAVRDTPGGLEELVERIPVQSRVVLKDSATEKLTLNGVEVVFDDP